MNQPSQTIDHVNKTRGTTQHQYQTVQWDMKTPSADNSALQEQLKVNMFTFDAVCVCSFLCKHNLVIYAPVTMETA